MLCYAFALCRPRPAGRSGAVMLRATAASCHSAVSRVGGTSSFVLCRHCLLHQLLSPSLGCIQVWRMAVMVAVAVICGRSFKESAPVTSRRHGGHAFPAAFLSLIDYFHFAWIKLFIELYGQAGVDQGWVEGPLIQPIFPLKWIIAAQEEYVILSVVQKLGRNQLRR